MCVNATLRMAGPVLQGSAAVAWLPLQLAGLHAAHRRAQVGHGHPPCTMTRLLLAAAASAAVAGHIGQQQGSGPAPALLHQLLPCERGCGSTCPGSLRFVAANSVRPRLHCRPAVPQLALEAGPQQGHGGLLAPLRVVAA